MHIDLDKINYTFSKKPLLVGGKAMEFYGLRKAGTDIDFIAPEEDIIALLKLYPSRVKDLWGDIGVCPHEFEIWRTICFFDYDYLKENAHDHGDFLIISLEKLLLMKALGMKVEKYLNDTKLIAEHPGITFVQLKEIVEDRKLGINIETLRDDLKKLSQESGALIREKQNKNIWYYYIRSKKESAEAYKYGEEQ